MNIAIRLAKPADIPDIVWVCTHSVEVYFKDMLPEKYIREVQAPYPDSFKNMITDDNTTHYVIRKDNKTIAVTCIKPPQDEDVGDNYYEFYGLSVHPDYYGQGIEVKAMDLIFYTIRNLGKTAVSLWVWDKNIKAIEIYEKCGFTADGKTKIFDRRDINLNGIRMKRDL